MKYVPEPNLLIVGSAGLLGKYVKYANLATIFPSTNLGANPSTYFK